MRRTKDKAQETRAAIIEAAEQAFYERGVAETSMEHIALLAGVTRGAVHHHFDGKAKLFVEVLDAAEMPWPGTDLFPLGVDPENGVFETLHIRTLAWIDMFAANPRARRLVAIMLRTTCTDDLEPAFAIVRASNLMTIDQMTALFQAADSFGELAEVWTPASARDAFVWMLSGLSSRWLLTGEEFDPVVAREAAADIIRSFSRANVASATDDTRLLAHA